MSGFVHLVGAGPGDPGLITKRGFDLLHRADVMVVDALVNPLLYNQNIRAEIIYVGKRGPGARHGSSQILAQQKINALLVRLAKEGKRVVRLKGGDPFVFGRGGEEIDALRRAKIPYEIVPGVTSAIAVPAYAGISVSDRRWASQVTFITGHERKEGFDPGYGIDWQKISPHGTLVILMGVSQWPEICKKLLTNGWSTATPVAAIESGTTPDQRTVLSTLAESEKEFQRKKLIAPAVLVVGAVARRANVNDWLRTAKPLLGKTIVVTRPEGQNESLVTLLEDKGAHVVACPAISIHALPTTANVQSALNASDWIVFLSANAVRIFYESGSDLPEKLKVCAVGPATAEAISRRGERIHLTPTKFNTAGVLRALGRVNDKSIFIPRVQNAPDDFIRQLKKKGAVVHEVAMYETRPAPRPTAQMKKYILSHAAAVTFTSASTVRYFLSFFSGPERQSLFRRAMALSIGPSTSTALKLNGVSRVNQSAQATMESLVKKCVLSA